VVELLLPEGANIGRTSSTCRTTIPTSTSCTRCGRDRRWPGALMTTQPRSAGGWRTYG